MATTQGTLLKRFWYTWKSLRLPWRRRTFIGMDLEGNTYWEMVDATGRSRPRRMVKYKDMQRDLVDYKLTPQWHQWLRATRTDPPSIAELQSDIVRLATLQRNAALADARWNAKPSLLNVGPHPPRDSVLESNTKFANDGGLQRDQAEGRGEVGADLGGKGEVGVREAGESAGDRAHGSKGEKGLEGEVKEDPWKAAEGKGEYQPGVWTPGAARPR